MSYCRRLRINRVILQAVTINRVILQAVTINRVILKAVTINRVILKAVTINRVILQAVTINRVILKVVTINRVTLQAVTINRVILQVVTPDGVILQAVTISSLSSGRYGPAPNHGSLGSLQRRTFGLCCRHSGIGTCFPRELPLYPVSCHSISAAHSSINRMMDCGPVKGHSATE